MSSTVAALRIFKEPPLFKILTPFQLLNYLTVAPLTANTESVIKTQSLIIDKHTKDNFRLSKRAAVFTDPEKIYVRHPLPNPKEQLIVAIACEFHYRDRTRLRKDERFNNKHIDAKFLFSFHREAEEMILVPIINMWSKV